MSVIYAYQIATLTPQFMPFVVFAFFVIVVMSLVNAFLSDRQSREFSSKINDMSGFVYELFSGIESIKLNDSESVMFKRWSEYFRECMSAYI